MLDVHVYRNLWSKWINSVCFFTVTVKPLNSILFLAYFCTLIYVMYDIITLFMCTVNKYSYNDPGLVMYQSERGSHKNLA